MKLMDLTANLPHAESRGTGNPEITGIAFDSRRVGGGELFVCLVGLASDGHDFAAAAVSDGAPALVVQRFLDDLDVPQVRVADSREALARLAAVHQGHPSRRLKVIGVTGTNGKTSVTRILGDIARAAGRRSDVFGTLGNTVGGVERVTGFTTPEAPDFQRLLRESADAGMEWVAMEVSSHALDQRRVFATDYAVVVFTNLSRDHLDHHGTHEAYFEAKRRLFTAAGRGSESIPVAVIAIDDPAGQKLWDDLDDPRVSFGFSPRAASSTARVTGPHSDPCSVPQTRHSLLPNQVAGVPGTTEEIELSSIPKSFQSIRNTRFDSPSPQALLRVS